MRLQCFLRAPSIEHASFALSIGCMHRHAPGVGNNFILRDVRRACSRPATIAVTSITRSSSDEDTERLKNLQQHQTGTKLIRDAPALSESSCLSPKSLETRLQSLDLPPSSRSFTFGVAPRATNNAHTIFQRKIHYRCSSIPNNPLKTVHLMNPPSSPLQHTIALKPRVLESE